VGSLNTLAMLTFRQFVSESTIKTATSIALALKITSLNRQVQQDRTATRIEKNLSSQIVWLTALTALGLTGEKK
jgi:hypothetical protein